jgi:hypothetical protein
VDLMPLIGKRVGSNPIDLIEWNHSICETHIIIFCRLLWKVFKLDIESLESWSHIAPFLS